MVAFTMNTATRYNNNAARVLSLEDIQRSAPAAFAVAPHAALSERYSFLRTIDVVQALMGAGWQPVAANQGKARDVSRNGLQRHLIRFRHPDMMLRSAGDIAPELILLNSHDGTSAYNLHAGLFRFACANGLIVSDAVFAKVAIRHVGVTSEQVVDASFEIVKEVPRLSASVEGLRSVELTKPEQVAFAESAARLRWSEDAIPVSGEKLATPRRYEDDKRDLFTTMNVVQENLIRGGQKGRGTTGKKLTTRAIGSVSEDTKINKALWHLAEEMKRLKTGA